MTQTRLATANNRQAPRATPQPIAPAGSEIEDEPAPDLEYATDDEDDDEETDESDSDDNDESDDESVGVL